MAGGEADGPTAGRDGFSRRSLLSAAGLAGAGGVVAGAYSGRGSEHDDLEREFPLETMLPVTYKGGVDDLGPYIQGAMDRLQSSGRGSLLLPPGRHRWNSPCYFAADTIDLTYELHGHGRGTTLELGPGLRKDFAIHLNQTRDVGRVVAFPRHPRLRVVDMYVMSDPSLEASLCNFSQASVNVERVRFAGLKYGLTGSGYTDLMSLRYISWEQPADDGRLYLQDGDGGDGLAIEQVTASLDAVIAELIGCNGAQISSCIGGCLIFEDCDAIEVVAHHYDSHGQDKPVARAPFVLIRSSRVSFRGGWDHVGSLAPAFQIEDSVSDHYSEVTWDGYSFGFRADAPDKERAPDVRVTRVQDGTKLRFRGCSSRLLPRGDRRRWAVGPTLMSDNSDVQAAMDADPTGPLEEAELVREDGGWVFHRGVPASGAQRFPVPTIEDCSPTTLFPGGHRKGVTYHYTLAAYSSFVDGGQHSAPAAEASITVVEPGDAIGLRVTLGNPRGAVRVWRGRSSGAFDSYADLTVGAYSTLLVDTGPCLSGALWKDLGNVPPPPLDAG